MSLELDEFKALAADHQAARRADLRSAILEGVIADADVTSLRQELKALLAINMKFADGTRADLAGQWPKILGPVPAAFLDPVSTANAAMAADRLVIAAKAEGRPYGHAERVNLSAPPLGEEAPATIDPGSEAAIIEKRRARAPVDAEVREKWMADQAVKSKDDPIGRIERKLGLTMSRLKELLGLQSPQ